MTISADESRADALAAASNNVANLELINSELAGRASRQDDANGKVDTKIAFLLGFIATAAQFLASHHPQRTLGTLAFASYILAFGCGLPALAIRRYTDIAPRWLLDDLGREDKPTALLMLCSTRVKACEANAKKHRWKTAWWWSSLVATILALVLSAIGIVDAGSHDKPVGQQPAAASGPTASPSAGGTAPAPAPGASTSTASKSH
ncbi:hypothetical protein [Catenulispora pinisilvae]|uniref:hypothetical protein n=1 Tax=Catenulispora pinisilvae TaxID=2705253 RepID=UPI001890CEFD|nr:hypothetical protein [Catenulispora pinisilvae]